MLVLTRKLGERILVPQCDLVVSVIAIEGKKVLLGISAPRSLAIYREEILAEVDRPPEDALTQENANQKEAVVPRFKQGMLGRPSLLG